MVADAVDLDVVGVAVAAVPVVDDDDVGVLLAQDVGQPLGGLLDGSARRNERGSSFCSHPVIPESW